MSAAEDRDSRSRASAHALARDGVALLARAFNHLSADEVPYRYAKDVQARFYEIGIELARLIEHGDIESNPAHVLYRRAVAAKSDATLQAVIRKASKRRARRPRSVFSGQST